MVKKLLFITLLAGAFTLTSCNKSHTCTLPEGDVITYNKGDYPSNASWKAYVKAAKSTCKAAGGKWK